MALKRITLQNFVIVEHLELDLQDGFTVITGETGAGKSILIDALQLALGGRADPGMIREGTNKTDICAEFDCPESLREWLDDAGFEVDDTLLLRRTMDLQGKSRGWVNGIPATATQLRALGEHLLDIHGQHAWQGLTRNQSIRALLDEYAGITTQELKHLWAQWRSDMRALEHAKHARDSLQRERDRLNWQISELDKLSPSRDTWMELNGQHQRLTHSQSLLEASGVALEAIANEDAGAEAALIRARNALQAHAHLEPAFDSMLEILESATAQVSDLKHTLHTYARRTDLDPQRLSELDGQMSQWLALSRRYKRPPEDLSSLWEGWKQELTELEAAFDLGQLEGAERDSAARYQQRAKQVSQSRSKAASQLATAITQAMQGLGMEGGKFEVNVGTLEEPSPEGLDEIVFRVAGHSGSTPKPINKVASGGELSRIALAISVATSKQTSVPTLIFDEVDSGVGGTVAETVGRLMHQLGQTRQVLAVTHLPQVAACADHHLTVSKQRSKKGTTSAVIPVSEDERVREIARMLGGDRSTGTTLAHAQEMLTFVSNAPQG